MSEFSLSILIGLFTVRNLLSNLDPSNTSEGLHKAVLSALGQGQVYGEGEGRREEYHCSLSSR